MAGRTSEREWPLNATAIARNRASSPSAMSDSQRRAWAHVLFALRSGGDVSFVVIGGSLPRGHGCDRHQPAGTATPAMCAYPQRLLKWLRERYPRARIHFENRAQGGLTSGGALLSLPSLAQPVSIERPMASPGGRNGSAGIVDTASGDSPSARMLLIDFAVNDAYEAQVDWNSATRRQRSQLFSNVTQRMRHLPPGARVHAQVQAASEAMVRYLVPPRPANERPSALLIIESLCWQNEGINSTGAHRAVAEHYGVPFFDFTKSLSDGMRPVGLASWPFNHGQSTCDACIRDRRLCASSSTPTIFSDAKHPDARGHEFLKTAIAWLLSAWEEDPQLHMPHQPMPQLHMPHQPMPQFMPQRREGWAEAESEAARLPPELPPPLSEADLLQQHIICQAPTTLYNAAELYAASLRSASLHNDNSPKKIHGLTSKPSLPLAPHALNVSLGDPGIRLVRGDWRLEADRAGKPGWITYGPDGSTMDFTVRFGAVPRLTLAFTLGYEGHAAALVGFPSLAGTACYRPVGGGERWDLGGKASRCVRVVEGQRTDGINVTQAAVLDMAVHHVLDWRRPDLFASQSGFSIKPFAEERFRIQLTCDAVGAPPRGAHAGAHDPHDAHGRTWPSSCGKFKLLAIRAC